MSVGEANEVNDGDENHDKGPEEASRSRVGIGNEKGLEEASRSRMGTENVSGDAVDSCE